MKQNKDIVIGLGEIGGPILKLLSKSNIIVGYDINKKLMDIKKFKKYERLETSFVHVCIPYTNKFISQVKSLYRKFSPKCIVIHSTISPYTTKKLQSELPIPIIYSATRGIHKRMISDIKKYTKFYALEKNAPKKNWASET